MQIPERFPSENGLFHVTNRGVDRRDIVLDDHDREAWLGTRQFSVGLHAVCRRGVPEFGGHTRTFRRGVRSRVQRRVGAVNNRARTQAPVVSALLAALAGCQNEGPAQKAGKAVDNATDKAGQQIEKAGTNIQDAAKGNK